MALQQKLLVRTPHRSQIEAVIDLALDPFGVFAHCLRRSVGKVADIKPPTPSLEHVVERETLAAHFADLSIACQPRRCGRVAKQGNSRFPRTFPCASFAV